ncbi:MAG TPA: aldo/keto reductase [Candidatus Dormibacteraeota bacterium]|nr:aldo/keto reductase [Candidatus Dormibacteraeota bacterium]
MSKTVELERRLLGLGGPLVSVVGVGTNSFGSRMPDEAVGQVVDAALDRGINLFDTADIYGRGESERLLGQALRGRRDRALIATKFGMRRAGEDPAQHRGAPAYIRASAEASLSRLGVEVIDLYQMHEPDPDTPIAESLGALHELVLAGKVRWIGCSNFPSGQVVDANGTASSLNLTPFVSAQDEYSLLNREAERDLLPALDHLGMRLLPYYPLARGLLTGKYKRGQQAPPGSRASHAGNSGMLDDQGKFDKVEALERFAERRGLTLLQVAIGALLGRSQVGSVIAGATRPEQVVANVEAASWTATEADWSELDRVMAGPA